MKKQEKDVPDSREIPAPREATANWGRLSAAERNEYVLAHLWCIDSLLRQHDAWVRAARMDREDIYQELALRLIRTVELYRPGKAESLKNYIFMHLRYALLNCGGARAFKEEEPHRDIACVA